MAEHAVPQTLAGLIERARAQGPVRVAIADAAQTVILETMREAVELGLAEPCLIGEPDRIEPLLKSAGWLEGSRFVVPCGADAAAAARAVAMARAGEADVVMKGNLHTDVFMHALLDPEAGLRVRERRVSHLFLLEIRGHDRLIGITDAAINIAPDLAAKAQICQNAIELFHELGAPRPHVAVLSAVETVTVDIGSTIDAASLTLMARRGQITDASVDGPLALDNAISARAAAEKGILSEVAGKADILLVPDLVTGNVLAKALEYLGSAKAAGIALGLSVPVVLTSRADTAEARLASLALARLSPREPGGMRSPYRANNEICTLCAAPSPDHACRPLPKQPSSTEDKQQRHPA
ncbi:MAG: bifunctional enoyl-CoA hydratase/phosphate acetyltransferase [Rhodobacteraceae bacterium]|nr:bifunctional enoyl-CoA hydratase/phosphate acetyltransferase [Paracoccaceae bacterium]